MDTTDFMARSISRILFRSFFLSPATVDGSDCSSPSEEASRLWLCNLRHPADLVLLYGFLPRPPRLVLPKEWPSMGLAQWICNEIECIRFADGQLDEDARHLMTHTLRSQRSLLLPLSWPGCSEGIDRRGLAEIALELARDCNARLQLSCATGTEDLPPEGSWIPRYRATSLHLASLDGEGLGPETLIETLDALGR